MEQHPFQYRQKDGIDYLEQGVDNIGKCFNMVFQTLKNTFIGIHEMFINLVDWISGNYDEY